jgi:hypothetical protein
VVGSYGDLYVRHFMIIRTGTDTFA